ncbi:unnamed protein product, partial [Mycena citricolor]
IRLFSLLLSFGRHRIDCPLHFRRFPLGSAFERGARRGRGRGGGPNKDLCVGLRHSRQRLDSGQLVGEREKFGSSTTDHVSLRFADTRGNTAQCLPPLR